MPISFIRHAESVANVAAHKHAKGSRERSAEYCKEEYRNATLSEKGVTQSQELRKAVTDTFDLIIVSTLKRTLETARVGLALDEGDHTETKKRTIASDSVREWAEGEVHPCDYRNSLSEDKVVENYPFIDFSLCVDADPIPENEPLVSVQARIKEFIALLEQRVGGNGSMKVAVVAHSAFLSCVWECVLGDSENKAFANVEVKTVPIPKFIEEARKRGY